MNINALMQQAQKMQREMTKKQKELESKDVVNKSSNEESLSSSCRSVLNMIKEVDINKVSPLEALTILANLKENL